MKNGTKVIRIIQEKAAYAWGWWVTWVPVDDQNLNGRFDPTDWILEAL